MPGPDSLCLRQGWAATTDEAIRDARSGRADAVFLADILVDDEAQWYVPCPVQCIVARGQAYR